MKTIAEALRACESMAYDRARAMPAVFYSSPDQLALEREKIFRHEWVCVGRVEEVADTGDFFAFDILDEPVVVVRGGDRKVRALSNVCRHRGTRIASGSGSGRRLVCPYHAWSYDLEGRLVAAPFISDQGGFDCSAYRLPVFPCEIWEGFIFVSLDPAAEPLAPRLEELHGMIRNYRFAEMRLRYLAEEVWDTNWKCFIENFMEGYHLSPLHRTTLHPVNPTRLCRHFAPGEAYFGYQVGFAPSLPRGEKRNPQLSDEEHDTCTMFAVPPALVVGGASDYSSFVSVQPLSTGQIRAKMGLFFYGDDWSGSDVDRAVELFRRTMAEDKEVLSALMRGLESRHYTAGPLGPADLEGTIVDFYRYLARQLDPALDEWVNR